MRDRALLSSILGTDGSPLISYLIVFLIMVVLLSAFAFGAKRLARGRLSLGNGGGQRGRQPRLGIVDIYELDRQRQLILLRRDNVEHLLLVGGPNDVVVERNIVRVAGARLPADLAERSEPQPEPPLSLPAEPERTSLPPPLPPFPEPPLSAPPFAVEETRPEPALAEPDAAAFAPAAAAFTPVAVPPAEPAAPPDRAGPGAAARARDAAARPGGCRPARRPPARAGAPAGTRARAGLRAGARTGARA